MSNSGAAAISLAVYPNAHLPFQPTPFTVAGGVRRSYDWDASKTAGAYDFSVYGPNRFLRRFTGTVAGESGSASVAIPQVAADPAPGAAPRLRLSLGNSGRVACGYTLTANDFSTATEQVSVGAGKTRTVDWPTVDGYYDVIVTTDSGAGFSYRFAGHID
jgi:phospholipase C